MAARILLIWPRFTMRGREPVPLGLLKIAGYHRSQGDEVRLVRSVAPLIDERPDRVYVSSLFTYDCGLVIAQVRAVQGAWPDAEVLIGGIWASLMPDRRASVKPKCRR